jgi:argininosuccinate synthase
VSGSVTLELRRGDDYTILDTRADHMAYAPHKLSMEKVDDPAFSPADRIGMLEMQNLSITDNRDLLVCLLENIAKIGPGVRDLPELLGGEAKAKK